jgi:hypothetical protein
MMTYDASSGVHVVALRVDCPAGIAGNSSVGIGHYTEVHLEGISEGALCVLELWRAEAEAGVLILLQVLQLQPVWKEEQWQQQ